jgi:ElaB/YqjD/DUF883 family membrane-anchored ribosome-binding protein
VRSRELGTMTADSDKDRALSEIRSDIESTRAKLAETLDAIEARLDVPKRVRKAAGEWRDKADAFRQENPTIVYAAAGAAAAIVIGATTLVVRGARR